MIFVSIASYRDKELLNTVESCVKNARHPEELHIGICWQYDEEEDLTCLDGIPNLKIHKVFWKDVEGSVCWARKLIQDKFYSGEDYYFQIDSHTRFVKDWDEKIVKMHNSLPNQRSVISVGPSYYYDLKAEAALPPEHHLKDQTVEIDGIEYDTVVQKQKLDSVGGIHFMYGFLPAEDTSKPFLSRHISAAWLFAPGSWVRDVPYDDELYFHGEEPTLTLRTYTNGYDLYNPNEFIIWHLKYLFPDRKRHWNNFPQEIINQFTKKSNERYKKIVNGEDLGKYGIGKQRTIEEWEIYSGISFKDYKAHPKTFEGHIPDPVTIYDIQEWNNIKK